METEVQTKSTSDVSGDAARVARRDERDGLVLSHTYRVEQFIGGGGMGDVYEATHVRLGRSVAVKFLRTEYLNEPRVLARFQREIRSLAQIRDPHVVDVLDCGQLRNGLPYLVMEFLTGHDLRKRLALHTPLALHEIAQIGLDVCRGLTAVHAAGLVHRDIKPGNLFLTRTAVAGLSCKILDFGLAKFQTSDVTHQGAVMGTIRYIAPEQLIDSARVTPQTDLYALGAVLYECMTGTPPFDADTVEQLMFRILNERPKTIAELRPDVPRDLAALVEACLSRDAKQRPASATELSQCLMEVRRCELRVSTDSASTTIGSDSFPTVAQQRDAHWTAQTVWRHLLVGLGGLALFVCGYLVHPMAPGHWRATVRRQPERAPIAALPTVTSNPAAPAAAQPSVTAAATGLAQRQHEASDRAARVIASKHARPPDTQKQHVLSATQEDTSPLDTRGPIVNVAPEEP